jgi:predicted Zn-dependent protease
MSENNLIFKKQKNVREVDLKKIENLGKRASDKIYGTEVQKRNDKVIPFYTDMDTYIKLQQFVINAKQNGNDAETNINKILRLGLELYFEKKERENNA